MDRILKEERKYIVDICQVRAPVFSASTGSQSVARVVVLRGPDNDVSDRVTTLVHMRRNIFSVPLL